MIEIDVFRDAAIAAIKTAAAEAYTTIAPIDLAGFALCVPEDVDSICHVYATRDWVADREGDYPEIGLIPVEWLQASSDALFGPLSRRLRDWSAADVRVPPDYHAGRRERIEAIVQAVEVCRRDGVFDPQTLVVLCMVDAGDDVLLALEGDAARRLNSKALASSYCNAR